MPGHEELDAIRQRYARRQDGTRYDMSRPDMQLMRDERQRVMRTFLQARGWTDLYDRRAAEIGCGEGNILAELLRFGFAPQHLTGIDLLEGTVEKARQKLPRAVKLFVGDARDAEIAQASQDLVVQFTVFSSILDDGFQRDLADIMWRWVKPSGTILWYDLAFNNPRNPDVRGVPLKRIRALFPAAHVISRRVTLAPPLARLLCRISPSLYPIFNSQPLLRSHIMAWLEKPAANGVLRPPGSKPA